jgi:hypothetical protein
MKKCKLCKKEIIKLSIKSNNQKYCADCQKIHIKKYRKMNNARWYLKNKENRKTYMILPHMIYFFIKRNAKSRNIIFKIKKSDFISWYNNQKQECHYCGRTIQEVRKDKREIFKNRLSIDRIDSNKGYTLKNILLCCTRCNIIKSNYFLEREMLKIGKILYKIYTKKEIQK